MSRERQKRACVSGRWWEWLAALSSFPSILSADVDAAGPLSEVSDLLLFHNSERKLDLGQYDPTLYDMFYQFQFIANFIFIKLNE